MTQIEQSQNFKQQYLNTGLGLIKESNSYNSRAVVANYISQSLVISAWATAAFAEALGGYNDKYAVSLSLYLCSYIPIAFQKFFNEKTAELRSQAQSNIDLANGREITHVVKFVDPTTV